jgi:large repetitive protein
VPPYTINASGIPAGLSFAGGTLSGQPKTAGTYAIGVQVTDAKGVSISSSFSFTITGTAPTALTITSSSLPDGAVNQPYSQALGASGGSSGYVWAQTGGQLPDGVSLASSGTLAGTPQSTGLYTVGVQVFDSSGGQALGAVSINIQPEPLQITTGAFPAGQVGIDYPARLLWRATSASHWSQRMRRRNQPRPRLS